MISMFHKMREREGGFTLVELLVVIVILGILIAIAVPTFLNQQDKAKDAKVTSYLNTAYKDAKAEQAFTQNTSFPAPSVLAPKIQSSEPELNITDVSTGNANAKAAADSLSNGALGVYSSSGGDLTLVGKTDNGKDYELVVSGNGSPTYSYYDTGKAQWVAQ